MVARQPDANPTSSSSTWSVTKLVAISALAVLLLVFSLAGATISAVTGIPLTSGFINIFVSGAMFALCVLVIGQFGSATLMALLYSMLAIPLPLFGAPGFAPKILIGLVVGIAADLTYLLLRRTPALAAISVGAVTQLLVPLSVAGIGLALRMPGVEKAIAMFIKPVPLVLVSLFGGVAGALGLWLYSRVRDRDFVRRIQASRKSGTPGQRS